MVFSFICESGDRQKNNKASQNTRSNLVFFFTICLGIIGLENYIQITSLISKRNLKSKFTFLNTTCYEIQSLHTLSLFFFFPAIKCSQAYNAIEYLNLWTIFTA